MTRGRTASPAAALWRLIPGAALLVALVASSSGCVDDHSLFIVQNQVPDNTCTVSTGANALFRPSGLLDVSLGRGYTLYPLVRSTILSSQATNAAQPETNSFMLREFRVKLDISDLPAEATGNLPANVTNFSVPTSGLLAPNTPERATAVKIIPDSLVQNVTIPAQASPIIVATVQAIAVRLGTSSEIEGAEFVYAVELCNGCLVQNVTPCPLDANVDPADVPKYTTNACGLPQDEPLACCGVGSGSLRCLTDNSL
ncbi:MAG: hypothetical protein KC503_02800 [Myxococcales bacterium]|nr:hypothetical protein [Myxococcales bacterium]